MDDRNMKLRSCFKSIIRLEGPWEYGLTSLMEFCLIVYVYFVYGYAALNALYIRIGIR